MGSGLAVGSVRRAVFAIPGAGMGRMPGARETKGRIERRSEQQPEQQPGNPCSDHVIHPVAPSCPRFPLPAGPWPPSPPRPPPWGPWPPWPPSPPLPVALSPPLPPSPPLPVALSPPSPPLPGPAEFPVPAWSIGDPTRATRSAEPTVFLRSISSALMMLNERLDSAVATMAAVPPMGAAVAPCPAWPSMSPVGAVASIPPTAAMPRGVAARSARGAVARESDDRRRECDNRCSNHYFFNRHAHSL